MDDLVYLAPQPEKGGSQISIRLITKLRMDGTSTEKQPQATIQLHLLLNPSHLAPDYIIFCTANFNEHVSHTEARLLVGVGGVSSQHTFYPPSVLCCSPTVCVLAAQSCLTLVTSQTEPAMDSLLCPWNSPGKNTGVGCHFLFQGVYLLGLP